MATRTRQRYRWRIGQWLAAAVCCLFLSACASSPLKGSFYQPLNVDGYWLYSDWTARLAALESMGVNTLYIQWTRHEASTFGGDSGWLWQMMRQASEQGFDLVLGLYAESVYFEHINESFDPGYWADYMVANQAWGKTIKSYLNQAPELNVVGFFFPGELNDQVLANGTLLAGISDDLVSLQRQLGMPLYVSTFYTGHLTTHEYQQALLILRSEHVNVLHQDGAGTRALNKNQVDEVLGDLNCKFVIIEELFVQRTEGEFDVLSDRLIGDKVTQSACRQRVFFSWRYMTPW